MNNLNSSPKIIILDYGMGNLGSIKNMLRYLGIESQITNEVDIVKTADKLILAGVGAFDNAVKNLNDLNLIPLLNELVIKKKIPVLGICLGMQLLGISSEEGELPGFGWIEARTIKFNFGKSQKNLKIPHMGWNKVKIERESILMHDMYLNPRFYFVHSFHLVCKEKSDILCTTNYGFTFISAIERDNIFGVQFHPEKSHKFGMKLLYNFARLI